MAGSRPHARRRALALLGASALALGVALAPGATTATPPASPSDCTDAAVAAIQGRYEAVRDLRARFVQTSRSVALGAGSRASSTSRGEVVFAKPGRMRWAYEEPEPSLVVSDGTVLWLYDPVRREAQRLPVGDGYLSGAGIQFLLGEGDMRRDFRVSALSCAETSVLLELLPRRDASYERLRVEADPRTGELTRTIVFDLFGNETEVAFSDVRANSDPPAGLFRFEPPQGVDVIDLATTDVPPGSP